MRYFLIGLIIVDDNYIFLFRSGNPIFNEIFLVMIFLDMKWYDHYLYSINKQFSIKKNINKICLQYSSEMLYNYLKFFKFKILDIYNMNLR